MNYHTHSFKGWGTNKNCETEIVVEQNTFIELNFFVGPNMIATAKQIVGKKEIAKPIISTKSKEAVRLKSIVGPKLTMEA